MFRGKSEKLNAFFVKTQACSSVHIGDSLASVPDPAHPELI
jgi:hypothetical protein